jgi:mannose-6-phosphate isomerase-like protein (cupin superfamily)
MGVNDSKVKNKETLGNGIFNPKDHQVFAAEEATVSLVYSGDDDISAVVWNLEPGQENSNHVHETNAHLMVVLQGSGVYVRDEKDEIPIKAGDCLIIPRNLIHGIRNTGNERLSYLASNSPGVYRRDSVGPQQGGH